MKAETATMTAEAEPIDRAEAMRALRRMMGQATEPLEVRYLIGIRDGFEDPVVFAIALGDETTRALADLAHGPGYSAAALARCSPGYTPVTTWVMPSEDAVDLAGRFAPHAAETLAQSAKPGCFKAVLAADGLVFASGGFPKPPE